MLMEEKDGRGAIGDRRGDWCQSPHHMSQPHYDIRPAKWSTHFVFIVVAVAVVVAAVTTAVVAVAASVVVAVAIAIVVVVVAI